MNSDLQNLANRFHQEIQELLQKLDAKHLSVIEAEKEILFSARILCAEIECLYVEDVDIL